MLSSQTQIFTYKSVIKYNYIFLPLIVDTWLKLILEIGRKGILKIVRGHSEHELEF